MATQEQIAESMNAMQRQIAELAGQVAEERHRGASLDRVAKMLDRWTTQQAQQPVARLVDTRGIGRVTDVHKPLISAGKVLGKGKVAILHSSGGSILSWNSPTGNLISRAMTKGTRQARTDELIKL